MQFLHFSKIPNEVKQIIHTKETDNSNYVMTCIKKNPPTSNTFKKLLLHKNLHSSYIQTKYNDKEKIINNTFITYVEPLLYDINHPALIQ